MSDNFTPGNGAPHQTANAYTDQLNAAGVPPEMHGWLSAHGVGRLVEKLGIHFVEMTAERMVATMPVEGNEQVVGILHGGAHLVLAETLGSFGAAIHAGPGHQALGIEISATHHRSISSGTVTGTATAIHRGKTLVTHEIVMTDEQGRRLSTARMTNMIRETR